MNSLPLHIDDELEFLASLVPFASVEVVEIGCGAGDFARKLATSFPQAKVIGVEIDELQHEINLSHTVPGLKFVLGAAQDLPFGAQCFDLALMLKSLHHVPKISMDAALVEVARVLRPNGILYISEPVFDGPFNEVVRLFHDEQQVREDAQSALDRAMGNGRWSQQFDHVFMTPIAFKNFDEFEKRIVRATYQDHQLSDELLARVRERFGEHMSADGARFVRPIRARLFSKAKHV